MLTRKETSTVKFKREEFTSDYNKEAHFIKHRKEFPKEMDIDNYEKIADILQRSAVDNRNIHGYMSQTREGKTAYCKYDKNQELFVVYTYRKGIPYTITCYKKTWRDFNGDKAIEYFDEIPQGK